MINRGVVHSALFILFLIDTIQCVDQVLDFHFNEGNAFKAAVATHRGRSRSRRPGPYRGPCVRFTREGLRAKMRDQGMFDIQFMAVAEREAAENFPDLTSAGYFQAAKRYSCDADSTCGTESAYTRSKLVNNGYETQFHRQRLIDGARYATETEPIKMKNPEPVHEPQFIVRTPGSETSGFFDDRKFRGFLNHTQDDHVIRIKRHLRKKRNNAPTLVTDIGQMLPIGMCSSKNEESDSYRLPGLINLCGMCRAVVELREHKYFPRFINAVICKEGPCLKDHGKCLQKHMELTILENQGTRECQYWVDKVILVPTCCQCGFRVNSRLDKVFFSG